MSKFDVVGFGALNFDTIINLPEAVRPDHEIRITSRRESGGGSAANSTVAMARLGLKTAYIGKVGTDIISNFLLGEFEREKIDTSMMLKEEGNSGFALCINMPNVDRVILIDPGVNDSSYLTKINLAELDSEWLHLSMLIDSNSFYENLDKFKGKISFAPGTIGVQKGYDRILPIIKRSNLIIMNKKELKALVNLDYKEGAKKLLDLGPETVIITWGQGYYILTKTEEFEPLREKVVVSEKPIDTTGAGDCFTAGFIYGLINNKSIKECGLIGNLIANQCVQGHGHENYPTEEKLKELLSKYTI